MELTQPPVSLTSLVLSFKRTLGDSATKKKPPFFQPLGQEPSSDHNVLSSTRAAYSR